MTALAHHFAHHWWQIPVSSTAMSGSLRQRSPGSWELRVYAGLDERGRRKYTTKTVKGGKRVAQRRLRELVNDVEAGAQSDHGRAPITVAELMERWVLEAEWSPSTRVGHLQCINGCIVPHIGDVRVDRLERRRIEEFYRTLARSGGSGGKSLSAASVKRTHTVLHAALGEAVRSDLLVANPATGARRPKGEAFEAEVPSLDEIRELLAAAPERMKVIIALAIATGARRGELMALRWSDIDAVTCTVKIARALALDGSIKSTKTKATGTIAVGTDTMAIVEAWRIAETDRWALASSESLPADMWLFLSYGWDRPLSANTITEQWRVLANSLGMENVRFHDLRHATATHLVANGVDVRTVAGRLRHANTSMTLDVYAAKVTESDVAAGKLLDGLVYGTDENET